MALLTANSGIKGVAMEKSNPDKDRRCSLIEEKRLELDLAYCHATYDSDEALARCFTTARESHTQREQACKQS
jgi:hypothetical protein